MCVKDGERTRVVRKRGREIQVMLTPTNDHAQKHNAKHENTENAEDAENADTIDSTIHGHAQRNTSRHADRHTHIIFIKIPAHRHTNRHTTSLKLRPRHVRR